jgi:hypothetical protein
MAMHDILGATNVSMQLDTDTRSETMRQTGQQEHGEHEGTSAHEVEMVRHSIFFSEMAELISRIGCGQPRRSPL